MSIECDEGSSTWIYFLTTSSFEEAMRERNVQTNLDKEQTGAVTPQRKQGRKQDQHFFIYLFFLEGAMRQSNYNTIEYVSPLAFPSDVFYFPVTYN